MTAARAQTRPGTPPTRAFTLLELIVIVGMLALLVSMLVPAMARARPNSHIIQCQNNLRQVGYACAMYAQDYRDYLPGPCWAGASSIYMWYPAGSQTEPTGPLRYFGTLVAYITRYLELPPPGRLAQTAQVMMCPAYLRAIPPGGTFTPPASDPVPYYLKQFIYTDPNNEVLANKILCYPFGRPNMGSINPPCGAALPDGSSPMHKTTEIPRAAEQWAIADNDRMLNVSGTYVDWVPSYPVHGYSGNKSLRNFLFFDWHVEAQKKNPPQNP